MGTVSGKSVMSYVPYQRRAHYAGSWYSDDKAVLDDQLQQNLDAAALPADLLSNKTTVRAVICPHAGYSYSGPTAAYSYRALQIELERRHHHATNSNNSNHEPPTTIVVLHPSHHVYLENCAVSGATNLSSPLGDLPVDDALRREILQLGQFSVMTQSDDEREHSGEMQYPYLAKIIPAGMKNVQVLPIMCGNLTQASEASFGQKLSEILQRSSILTVVCK